MSKKKAESQNQASTNNNKTKFTLYNLAGKEKAYYLVDRIKLENQPIENKKKAVAHSIIIIDRSGSMYNDIQALKDTLIKLLTLDEYINFQLVVTLISYSSQGDLTCHFQRVSIQEVMKNNSPYLEEIKKISVTSLTCISQALEMAKSLIQARELTGITLHSDGYANDSSPNAEARALETVCAELARMDVFVNTIAYSDACDFKLLSKIANSVSGICIQAGNVREVYDAIYSTSKLLGSNIASTIEEPLTPEYSYQVLFARNTKKINGTSGTLRIFGLEPEDEVLVYKYQLISQDVYNQLTDIPVAQNHESVYAFAKANLVEGNLNTAKYALVSSFDATLSKKHSRALTNEEIALLAQDLDTALFYPIVLREHEILDNVKVNEKISLLELIKVFEEHRSNIIINFKHLQKNYLRKGINRLNGFRDAKGNLVKPWLSTEYIDTGNYVEMGSFEINHNTATINMLLTRKVRLLKTTDKTPIIEVAGLLVNDLKGYNNYTIVSDGEINVKELRVKISSKRTFDLLKEKGVIDGDKFDFRYEYSIKLDNLPLVGFDEEYGSINGLFDELAQIKVLTSIIAAHIKNESDIFLPEQLDELKRHYLSKNLYVNFPTTNEYTDIREALAIGMIDSRISYKIDIGSREILNFGKFHSANKFLDRMYRAYDTKTGEIFPKASFSVAFDKNIAYDHKQLSPRMKITKVDDFMKPIFDDFLGLDNNGSVANILTKVGAELLARVLRDKRDGKAVSKEEMVVAMTAAYQKLNLYAEEIYRDTISPLVFYIGTTGLLPDEMASQAMTVEQVSSKYPCLQFSKDEKEATFFEVGDSIISVYAKAEFYSRRVLATASNA